MIKFKKISIRNFFSYGNEPTVLEFDNIGTTLITGEDLDNTTNGKDANGTGKTTIINALVYALYGQPLSTVSSIDNIINDVNKKNLEVELWFEANGILYSVKRCRKLNTNSNHPVYLNENGVDITDAVNVNARIVSILGIPYDIFVRIVVFSAAHEPFLALPSRSTTKANQTEIIEELFRITMLSKKADKLKKIISEMEKMIEIEQVKVNSVANEKERLQQQITNTMTRMLQWEDKRENDISSLTLKLDKIKSVDIEGQRKLHDAVKELTASKRALNNDINTAMAAASSTATELAKAHNEMKHLQDSQCWYCNQEFPDAATKVEGCSHEINRLTEDYAEIDAQITELTNELKDVNADITDLTALITVDNISELLQISNQSAAIQSQLDTLQSAENPHEEALQELKLVKVTDADSARVDDLMNTVKHQKFLLKLLTKKDSFVRKAILDKNIPFLNGRLQHYLSLLGLAHKVEFTHEMTAKISKMGIDKDFGNLSAGQRARVNLALAFAFRDVLQNMHTPVNICLLDEVLDVGLSPVGVQAAVRMLKQIAVDEKLSLYVVSHREEIDGMFGNILNVQLSGGFSTIEHK